MPIEPSVSERRVAEAIVDALAEADIRFVVGMPGGHTGTIFSALHDHPSIRVVQVREESIGSTMAEAYGRYRGQPIVVMGQGEWIAGNAGQGFMEAHLGCAPMLILTDLTDGGVLSHHAPYQSGSADYGTWDTRQTLAGMTKRVMVSLHPAQAVQHVQLGLKHAMTGEPGPVAVVFHTSALRGRVQPGTTPLLYPTDRYLPRPSRAVDVEALESAARTLAGAQRPVIIAGNGVRVGQATAALAALAETLDAPVATTASGKGVFDEQDVRAAGVIGSFGAPAANALVGESDVVLAIGTKLAPHDTANDHTALLDPSRQSLIQIDVEPLNAGWTFPVDHSLIGDAGFLMQRLRDALAGGAVPGRVGAGERVAGFAERDGRDAPAFETDEVPFHPQRVIRVLEECFPEEGVLSTDAGENRLFMMHWYRSRGGGRYLQPAAGGGMGYAIPAAMGAKLADPDRPVLAICGDGGFAMSLHAIMSAVQEEIPIAVLVFNNGALGWVLHGMGEKAVAANFAKFDHEAIAQALGCEGVRVSSTSELRAAIESVSKLTRPLVIDVPLSLETSFQDVTQKFDGH